MSGSNPPSKLKLKDRPTILLDENPTTGYRWEFEIPDGMEVERDEYISDGGIADNGEVLVGCGGQRLIHFKFTAPGKYRVVGRYLRLFDKSDIAREIVLKYHVSDGKNENRRNFH